MSKCAELEERARDPLPSPGAAPLFRDAGDGSPLPPERRAIEAKKYIPIPSTSSLRLRRGALPPSDASGKKRLGILIAVTQKKNIEHVQACSPR